MNAENRSQVNNLAAHKSANEALFTLLNEMKSHHPCSATIDNAVLATQILCFIADDKDNVSAMRLNDTLEHYYQPHSAGTSSQINNFIIEINRIIDSKRFVIK